MKKYLAIAILVGFTGWALLGFFEMNHVYGMSSNGVCPSTSLPTSDCPPNALTMTLHHFTGYQSLLTSFIYTSIFSQVLTGLLLLVAFAFLFRKSILSLTRLLYLFTPQWLLQNFGIRWHVSRAITRWLSLLLNSPAVS